jgi:hypothetical protein
MVKTNVCYIFYLTFREMCSEKYQNECVHHWNKIKSYVTQKMYDLIPMIKIDSPPVMFGKTLMFIVDYDSLFSLRVVR